VQKRKISEEKICADTPAGFYAVTALQLFTG